MKTTLAGTTRRSKHGAACQRLAASSAGAILAVTRATLPSVVQVRAQDVSPEHLADLVVRGLRQHEAILEQGALISIDEVRLRSRILPFVE